MGALDLSATKCYTLEMPNANDEDPRVRLDCRTGCSIDISNSRVFVFGGCTLKLALTADFNLVTLAEVFAEKVKEVHSETWHGNGEKHVDKNVAIDFNQYLSAECFRLSLINRKWNHYSVKATQPEETNKPAGRMFHNMAVYENYVIVSGGLKFDKNNKLEVLNDVWRFDTVEKTWKCCYENGNPYVAKRFDHLATILPNLEMFDKSYIQPGLCISGGLDENGRCVEELEIFDLVKEKFKVLKYPSLREFQNVSEEITCKGSPMWLRQTKNSIYASVCSLSNQTKIYVYERSPSLEEYEPLVSFNESTKGVRIPRKTDFDISGVSDMHFLTMGMFGETIIFVGFSGKENKISSYMFNIRTYSWKKLHVSCMHKRFTHKLTRGFVWESHHKLIYLGSMKMDDVAISVDYFDTLVVLSLPFTNFFGKKSMLLPHKNKNIGSSVSIDTPKSVTEVLPHGTEFRKRSESTTSFDSGLSHARSGVMPSHSKLQQEHTAAFATYSYHVAQQLHVNSVRSVLPAYAIAIGKNAFERNTAFSDFDMVCSDGTIIPVPISLCRRRWGIGFDELFADAYAKSFIENKASEILSYQGSSEESVDHDQYSLGSKYSGSAPYFRYPFQDKESNNDHSKLDVSPVRNSPNIPSPITTSRNNSISGNIYASRTLERASVNLANSRRSSYQQIKPRHNSISNASSPRRNSIINGVPSRRNSAGILQINQPPSRRGSVLSRSSFLSSSTSSHNSVSSNPLSHSFHTNHYSPACSTQLLVSSSHPSLDAKGPNEFYTDGQSVIPLSQPNSHHNRINESEYSSVGDITSLNKDQRGSLNRNDLLEALNIDILPPQLPMPTVLPNGEPMHDIDSASDTMSRTVSHIYGADDTLSKKISNISATQPDDLIDVVYGNDLPLEHIKFDPLRFPRELYLPYPRNTVRAIIEYMYSGQIGANWKLFPTGMELLLATKQLDIPLLYDLVLELFFVVLGLMEASLKSKLILYLEAQSENKDDSHDDIYNILDVKGKDDMEMDLELLLEAAVGSRRDSGGTISSDMKFDESLNDKDMSNISSINTKKREASQLNGIDPLDVGPTEKVGSELIFNEIDPRDTNFEQNEEHDMDSKENPFYDITEHGLQIIEDEYIKITGASMSELGYEVTDESDNGGDENDGAGLLNSFKKFNMGGNINQATKDMGTTSTRKSTRKLKQWPVFKDMLNEDNFEEISEVVIELFIETGALINDSKLMLQSIHVQELYKKVKSIAGNDADNNSALNKDDAKENAAREGEVKETAAGKGNAKESSTTEENVKGKPASDSTALDYSTTKTDTKSSKNSPANGATLSSTTKPSTILNDRMERNTIYKNTLDDEEDRIDPLCSKSGTEDQNNNGAVNLVCDTAKKDGLKTGYIILPDDQSDTSKGSKDMYSDSASSMGRQSSASDRVASPMRRNTSKANVSVDTAHIDERLSGKWFKSTNPSSATTKTTNSITPEVSHGLSTPYNLKPSRTTLSLNSLGSRSLKTSKSNYDSESVKSNETSKRKWFFGRFKH